MKQRSNRTIWVNMDTFRWAKEYWKHEDVKIDTYVPAGKLMITVPGFLINKRRKRMVRIDYETCKLQSERAEITTRSKRSAS